MMPASRSSRLVAIATGIVLFVMGLSIATIRADEAGEEAAPLAVTRIYNIRDLIDLSMVQDNFAPPPIGITTASPAGSGGGGSLFSSSGSYVSGQTRDQIVREFVDTIKYAVAPDTWRDAGGTIGTVRELNGQLVISQTRDNHSAIQQLLDNLRTQANIQVQVEARIYSVDQNTLQALTAIGPVLTIEESNAKLATAKLLGHPRATMYSGRCASLALTTEQNFVSSFSHPSPADSAATQAAHAQPSTGIDPVISTLTTGSSFHASGTASEDKSQVVVHFHARHTLRNTTSEEKPALTAGKDLTMQTPATDVSSVDAAFTVPSGKCMLLGGDRIRRVPDAAEPGEREPNFIIYLVRASVLPSPAPAPAPAPAKKP